MQFKNGTAASLGIDTSRRFRVVQGEYKGNIVTLRKDDGSECPSFNFQDGRYEFIYWNRMEYADVIKSGKVVTMYPKTTKAAKEEIEILEKSLIRESAKRDAATTKVNEIETALAKLRNL